MRARCFIFFSCLFCAVVLLTANVVVAAQSSRQPVRQFRAGAALSNITPFLGKPIVGGFNPQPARHIHDELHARCLVLDDGQTRVAIVVCDNLGVAREVFDEAKRMIHARTGLPPENMLMSATHTHSAISARGARRFQHGQPLDEYQLFLARRIADGVVRAVNNLEPARIGWGVGREPDQVFNRRWFMKPGTPLPNPFGGEDRVRMNPGVGNPDLVEPAGPTDPDISFISIQSSDGRPIALLANYSLHYVGGTGPREISADYFALFADRIQQLLGADRQDPPFIGILSNGTSGDINNINFPGPRERLPPYERMRLVADAVAAEVFRVYKTVNHHEWVPLNIRQRILTLQTRRPSAEQLERTAQILSRPEDAPPLSHPRERAYAERLSDIQKFYPSEVPVTLQALRVGEVGIAAIPAEVFVEIGLELKERSPFQPTFTISLANGWYGYLPTVKQHKLGGYETWLGTNILEVEAAPKIIDTLLELFGEIRGDPAQGFEPLFDGESFKGWEGDIGGTFRIEEGAIKAGSLRRQIPRNEFLCTEREFADFELRLKFKLLGDETNAGIQFHTRRIPDHHEVIGYQADLGNPGWWGSLYDESRRRKVLAQANTEEVNQILKRDDWNEYVIRAHGGRIQFWINDYQTVDYTESDPSIEQTGLICLQIHSGPPGEAWYKGMRVKKLR